MPLEFSSYLPQTVAQAETLGNWLAYALLAALFIRW